MGLVLLVMGGVLIGAGGSFYYAFAGLAEMPEKSKPGDVRHCRNSGNLSECRTDGVEFTHGVPCEVLMLGLKDSFLLRGGQNTNA